MKIYCRPQYSVLDSILERKPHLAQLVGWLNVPRGSDFHRISRYGLPVACDNGAFHGFNPDEYLRMVERLSSCPIAWIAAPDEVGDARKTLSLFKFWQPRLRHLPLAYVLQDGAEDLEIPWNEISCAFLGGTTAYKLSRAAADLMLEAKRHPRILTHIGRVNSRRRLLYSFDLGVDSVDGSGYSQYSKKELEKALDFLHALESQSRFPFMRA